MPSLGPAPVRYNCSLAIRPPLRNRKFEDSLLEGDGFEPLVPLHKSHGFPWHFGDCGGIGGLLIGTHVMVQPFFFSGQRVKSAVRSGPPAPEVAAQEAP